MRVKEIVLYEQLMGKSFLDFNVKNSEDVLAILYVRSGLESTFEVFKAAMESCPKFFNKETYKLQKECEIEAQFRENTEGKEDGEPIMIGTMAYSMIVRGVNPDYIMNCTLTDLMHVLDAYQGLRREQLEEKRTFAFLNIAPHVDTSKMHNGAKDLIRFAWEEEEKVDEEEILNELNKKKSDIWQN